MKNILHFFILLFIACALGGGIYLAVENTQLFSAQLSAEGQGLQRGIREQIGTAGQFHPEKNIPPEGSGSRQETGRNGVGHADSFQIGGLVGLAQNLAVIAIITLVIVVIRKLFSPGKAKGVPSVGADISH